MTPRLLSWLGRPNLLRGLLLNLRLAVRLLREPRVPFGTKAFILLPALYVVSPIDLLPDLVPVLGQLDDLVVAVFALELFVMLCPADVVGHHRAALAHRQPYSPMGPDGQVIDVEFRRD